MRIKLASIFVDDQEKALKFYGEILGFKKHADISAGGYRWLTAVTTEQPNGPELLLESNANPVGKTFQQANYASGKPALLLEVSDVHSEYERMKKLGVRFNGEPVNMGPVTYAMFDDTCGNLVQLVQNNR